MFQDAQWSYTFGKIGQTLGGVISNPVFLLGLAGYIAFKLDQLLDPDWRAITADMTPDGLRDWLETQNLAGATIGGFLGLFVAGPLGGIIGSVLGSAAVEVGEAAYEGIDEASDEMFEGIDSTLSAGTTIGIVSGLIGLMNALEAIGEDLVTGDSHNGGANGGGGGF